MQEVVVDQIPAPGLVVRAQEGDISVALIGRFLGGYADYGHRAQGSFPYDFPRMATLSEANLSSRAIRALGYRISVNCEPVGLDVDIPGAVLGVPGVVEGPQLGLVGRKAGQELGLEGVCGQLADAVQSPDVVIFICQESKGGFF